jgi:hypothetical protein
MFKKAIITLMSICLIVALQAQTPMTLPDILTMVEKNNPGLKMYEAEARAFNEASKGAYSWMPPEGGAGLFMTPYNTKEIKAEPSMMKEGMGFFMISAQQMFPNRKKQDAEAAWMRSMSTVEAEKRKIALNELLFVAKKSYYEWLVLLKREKVLDEGTRILDFMIKSAEIRYKNGLGKISAYYKAKAALANIDNMKLMLENDIPCSIASCIARLMRNSALTPCIPGRIFLLPYSTRLTSSAAAAIYRLYNEIWK